MFDVKSQELPLLGLLNEVLLPGETRSFQTPAVDAGTLKRLASAPPKAVAVLCITTRAELPGLVAARWATVAELVKVEPNELVLTGGARARIQSVSGGESPYQARLLPAQTLESSELSSLISEGHRLFAALDSGARPRRTDAEQALRDALFGLVRASMTEGQLASALNLPLHELLRKQAQLLTVDRVVEHESCQLERLLAEIAEQPELSKEQRQLLWSQVVAIQRRLDVYEPGVSDTDTEELGHLQRRLQQLGLPKAARVVAKRGLRLLRSMATSNHDYAARLGHLDFMAQLPWHPEPQKRLLLSDLERELDRDHHGLEEPKRRIAEYFAVRELGGKAAGTVLCLVGPPGVGKTSLARSIARALGRPLCRVALGGVHEESEIRGHRLSFVAAGPGRILRGVADAGSASCVLLLDELDKVGHGGGRSPAAALLEVLDQEQNHSFRDNYLGVTYDLSNVLFLCTANELQKISGPLRDRLEVIELEGYTLAEKVAIAQGHLLQRMASDCGLSQPPAVDVFVLERLIEGYTKETGVRELGRKLSALFRSRALTQLRDKEQGPPDTSSHPAKSSSAPLTWEEIVKQLGPPRYRERNALDVLPIGVAIGLSVGPFGGATLYVEVGCMPGNGEVRSTGQLGEVMRESVHAALSHIKMAPQRYGIDPKRLNCDLHVHLPEAATAKEGPSAGITVFAALLSALKEKPLPADLAMTGEVTLTGDVLPVGGIRAKLLAAERAGARRVLIPEHNHADVPPDLHLEVIRVERLEQALPVLLGNSDRSETSVPNARSDQTPASDAGAA